jgi:glucosylceramidase
MVEGLSKFVNEYLMPAVRKVQPDIQIMMYDDQLINLTNAAMQLAEGTRDNSNGIAFHWYTSLESIYENDQPQESFPDLDLPFVGGGAGVKTLYDAFNGSKFLLMTESCSGYSFGTHFVGPRHGSFGYGYNAAHDLLWNVRNRAAGYVYWNLVLDSLGGPNLAGNYVDSPMYVTSNGTAVVMNPSFFYLTHFSRAVPPGSVAIHADVECGASRSEYCQFVAFRTPKEDVVVIMTNDKVTTDLIAPLPLPPLAEGQGEPIEWTIRCKASTVRGVLPWKGIQTVIMPCFDSINSPALTF